MPTAASPYPLDEVVGSGAVPGGLSTPECLSAPAGLTPPVGLLAPVGLSAPAGISALELSSIAGSSPSDLTALASIPKSLSVSRLSGSGLPVPKGLSREGWAPPGRQHAQSLLGSSSSVPSLRPGPNW